MKRKTANFAKQRLDEKEDLMKLLEDQKNLKNDNWKRNTIITQYGSEEAVR